jgi:predicted nucleic acid-binding protein
VPRRGEIWYVDTSALVKTVILEPETDALRAWLAPDPTLVSSGLITVEAPRAVGIADPAALPALSRAIATLTLITVDDGLLASAAGLDPPSMRSLDAIHLASALLLGDDLGGILTYDQRMAGAATTRGITVAAPAGTPA